MDTKDDQELAKSQEGFLSYIVLPLYRIFTNGNHLDLMEECVHHLETNKQNWASVANGHIVLPKPTVYEEECKSWAAKEVVVYESMPRAEKKNEAMKIPG